MPTKFETITTDLAEHILTITLNRPDKLNAYNRTMGDELIAALDAADANDEVRAIIFTGSGRAYCAGADLAAGGATFDYNKDGKQPADAVKRDGGGLLTLRLFDCLKPVIGAINGPAVGVGATMLLAMDIRIASDTARFGYVFSRRGIVPEACSSWFLPRIVGISKALEWSFSGRLIDAAEALEARLVSKLCPPEKLIETARAIARDIAQNAAPVSVALTRQMMWKMLGAAHPMAAHKLDSRGVQARGASADAKEGVASFLEKRPAQFPNRVSADMPAFFPWWDEPEFE